MRGRHSNISKVDNFSSIVAQGIAHMHARDSFASSVIPVSFDAAFERKLPATGWRHPT